MGRRRWKFITIVAFLLFIKDAKCQDDNEFYYTPVERNFAQVQPPLFANNRPATYFEHGDNFRVPHPSQQPLYNEGNVRFPSPNYNQNPTPFQLPTGRSQADNQYYLNEQNFSPTQRQRFRPALPHNYQIVHPASTKRPDTSQIHSVAYQNDPSKPETFLGQITLNNPDIDYLQNSRFKNIPFDGNSLKSNGQSGHIQHEDFDTGDHDIFDHPRVTTYNPYKLNNKQRLNVKPNTMRFPSFDENQNYPNNRIRLPSSITHKQKPDNSATENKALLDLEPLLEDDIGDIRTFKELLKNNADVQVIKSNNNSELDSNYDSKPDASSIMNADNVLKDGNVKSSSIVDLTTTTTTTTAKTSTTTTESLNSHEQVQNEEEVDNEEYVEYYDDAEGSVVPNTTLDPHSEEPVTDIYDDYDATEESEKPHEELKSNITDSYEILVMKPNNETVKDDNFKHFVDTTVIDQTEKVVTKESIITSQEEVGSSDDVSSIETPSILGQEVVSVVTTKSVVNGTISIPEVTFAPSTPVSAAVTETFNNDNLTSVTTENWRVVASVQTSRSVSGARFLPFPTVEHGEKKQVLEEEDEEIESVTVDPKSDTTLTNSSTSTENINDKLDSIQSELSSAVLSGSLEENNKNIELITESTTETTTTTTTPFNAFTLKMTTVATVTEKSAPNPLPVLIKKFVPRVSTSTTPKPKKKPSLVTVMDDLAGFLPPGYKHRPSFKDKKLATTTSTTTTSTTIKPEQITEDIAINETQARSSGISSKNKVIILDDKSLLPKEYKPKDVKPNEDLLKKFGNEDINKFLPPNYKPPVAENPETKEVPKLDKIFDKVQKVDISAFLPKGFNASVTTTKPEPKIPGGATTIDISAFLPPGFKLNNTDQIPIKAIKVADISNLLPPGFTLSSTEETVTPSLTTKSTGGIKLVFPSRPGSGSKPARKNIASKPVGGSGPSQVTPKIQKGWPTRASTEFTGWPSPSTTPFSIEKLLEAQRNATASSPLPELSTEAATRRTLPTTTTTHAPPPSTTPGVCRKECDIAATINIVAGVKWVPELLDHHTEEWKTLAKDVKEELNSVYTKSDFLSKWYKGVRVDEFTPGDTKDIKKRSVYVDYVIELNSIEEKVDTVQLKKLFHKSLYEASPGSVIETVSSENENDFDPDIMLGDQPDEERMKKSNEKMTKTIDKSAGKLEIGKFVMDPAYTEFIVLPKREEPKHVEIDEESFLPQWGIAVIVITMASLLFVIIFGVTVLVNRQKSAKAKQPIPLSEDMIRELDKSHMGGLDDMHQMKERDLPYLPSGKRMSTAFIEQLAYPNPGDSWRSEWTPQLQKYMQHYTPDSGRGSQIYGPTGNAYGYGGGSQMYGQTGGGSQIYGQTGGGSQLYGQTGGGSQHYGHAGGGGSQVYGYTGEYPPRTHYSRRRSDYDSNF